MDERLDFSQTWPVELQEVTTYTYGWSFVLAGLGIFTTVLATTLWYLSYTYFWVSEFAKPIVDEKDLQNDSDNNNNPEGGNSSENSSGNSSGNSRGNSRTNSRGNSAETTIATDPDSIVVDLMESNLLHP